MINIQQQKTFSKQQHKVKRTYFQQHHHQHPQKPHLSSHHQHRPGNCQKQQYHYQQQFHYFGSKEILLTLKQILHPHTNILRWNLLTIFLLCNCIDFCISNKISSHTPYSTLNSGSSLPSSLVSAFEPDFVIPLENVTVAQGRDATFTCVVNNLGGHRVSGDSGTPAKLIEANYFLCSVMIASMANELPS